MHVLEDDLNLKHSNFSLIAAKLLYSSNKWVVLGVVNVLLPLEWYTEWCPDFSFFLYMLLDYVSVRVEDDVEAVIIQNSEIEDAENGLSTQGCVSVEQNAQVNSDDHYMTQLAYGKYT